MRIARAASAAQNPVQARRARMCRTAAQLFRDRGYDATSVSDVARALGMTKAGLYHHFESKEALLFEIMMYGLERVRDEVIVPVRAVRDPEERLRQLIVRHARIATRGHGAIAHLGDEIRALPASSRRQVEQRMRIYFDLIRDTLTELKAAGRLRQVDPTVAAFSLLGMILWLPRWFRVGGRLDQASVANDIASFALGGLLAPARRPAAKLTVSRRRFGRS
ncbi:MAG TPA: TetR/AcrR family transcriptional regulator [Vicinamibacterales bacterium]|jgi:AcrR family transcriptional regulator|nr:TetR/AcrR family transcriptional regulator [Vicinamibacterales bacterium]